MESKQHVQLPVESENSDLAPRDQLIYLSIRRFMNGETKTAWPSLKVISRASGASIPTIRNSIKTLEEKDYLKVVKEGRSQKYVFNELKKFEPFSYDFLDNKDLSFTEKAYLVASQQYMYKDVEGIGKMSLTNKELADKINVSESTISRTNKSLVRKNYLTIVKNESRDLASGCRTDTKLFQLNKLGQAVIWLLKDHEDRINENTEDIKELKETVKNQQILIEKLLKERNSGENSYIL